MEEVKRAFSRVKEDILFLGNNLEKISNSMLELKQEIKTLQDSLDKLRLEIIQNNANKEILSETTFPTHIDNYQTDTQHIKQTPTHNSYLYSPIRQDNKLSSGNDGVPTDRQTDRQTDIQHAEYPIFPTNQDIVVPTDIKDNEKVVPNDFDKAVKILESLDSIKKEIRFKFKRLTEQEFKVFSMLYSLEEKGLLVDYKLLSEYLALTESSIRDYVGKLMIKGIPILKKKVNNKQITLHISPDLKEITPLETIIKLREL